MKYYNKYYLKKELEIILLNFYDIKKNYELFKSISSEENYSTFCNEFPYLSNIILNSLFNSAIIGLFKTIYDEDNNSNSIKDILRFYNNDKNIFSEKKYYYIKNDEAGKRIRRNFNPKDIKFFIDNIETNLNNNENICSYIKTYRNKSLAHSDKKYGFNKKLKYNRKGKVTYGEIEKFIDDMINNINQLYNCIFGITYVFTYNELDELKYLKIIIDNEKKKNKKII